MRNKRFLDFGLRILDLGYSACRESFVERSILKRLSEAIPLGTPPFLKGAGGIFKILQVDFSEVS